MTALHFLMFLVVVMVVCNHDIHSLTFHLVLRYTVIVCVGFIAVALEPFVDCYWYHLQIGFTVR